MNKTNKKKYSIYTIGTPTIMMVLVVLCLITFATLSLVSANADYKLSETLSEKTAGYYEASSEAQVNIQEINDILLTIWQDVQDDEYYEEVADNDELNTIGTVTMSEEDDVIIEFSTTISDIQDLEVVLKVVPLDDESGTCYEITSYKSVSTQDWEADDELDLYVP